MKTIAIFAAAAILTLSSPPESRTQPESTTEATELESLLDQEVSTAAKYRQSVKEAPASVTIITAEEIERYGYHTLDELLQRIRGFYTTYDRNYVYIGVRGFDRPSDYNNRILMLLNGHTLNENIYGSTFFGTELGLDLDDIKRIEIVRGPGSALYGNNAMFAVINLITKSGSDLDGLRVSLETGSFGRRLASLALGGNPIQNLDLAFSGIWGEIDGDNLYFPEYDNSTDNFGVAETLDWDQFHGGFFTAKYKGTSLLMSHSWREKGIPTGAWEMTFNDDRAKSLDERSVVELKREESLSSKVLVMARGYYDSYRYEGQYPYDALEYDASDGRWLGGEAQLIWDVYPFDRVTLGGQYEDNLRADYRYWTSDAVLFDQDFPFICSSLYLQNEYQATRNLAFTLGIRRDRYASVTSAYSPRAAMIYHPYSNATLKLVYNQAFRAPNVYELYYADSTQAKGNSDLNPERIKTLEAIWEQQISENVYGTLSLFNNRVQYLIDQTVDTSDGFLQFRNFSNLQATGIELGMDARFRNGLWAYASYGQQASEDQDLEEGSYNSPTRLIKFGASYPVRNRIIIAYEAQYESSRRTLTGVNSDPFFISNLKLTTKKCWNHISISFIVKNLFDVSYSLPGGYEHRQDLIPQDGRTLIFKAKFQL